MQRSAVFKQVLYLCATNYGASQPCARIKLAWIHPPVILSFACFFFSLGYNMENSPSLLKMAVLKTAVAAGETPGPDNDDAASARSDPTLQSSMAASEYTASEAPSTQTPDDRPAIRKCHSTPNTFSFPKRLQKTKRLLFKARLSKFDISNPETANDTFRGFYTLFWLAMGFYLIQTAIRCYEQEGVILSLGFFRLFSKDGLALLISDLTMVATTVFSVLFSKLLVWGVIRYEPVGVILQHMCQTIFLFMNIYWTFWRWGGCVSLGRHASKCSRNAT